MSMSLRDNGARPGHAARDRIASSASTATASGSSSSSSSSSTVSEEHYIATLASYIRVNSERLSATSRDARTRDASWASTLMLTSNPLKPLTLTLSLYHLYYCLLKIQEAGFADVGDLDVPFSSVASAQGSRRPPAVHGGGATGPGLDQSDARSVRTGWSSVLSVGASSFGSGWWGGSATSSTPNGKHDITKDLRLIYTAFNLLPSLRIVMKDTSSSSPSKGKHREVEGFPFSEYPGDRMVPMHAFKSLQRLETQGIDARILLFGREWDNVRVIQVRDAGLDSIGDLLLTPEGSGNLRQWSSSLQVLDVENNDIMTVDAEDLVGLERLHSLSLRKNLLNAVPSALVNLTSLRALDLSDNMVDSVLAIYRSLPALTLLNLRNNRISSLCGLERLLSLQVLDIRTNVIEDVSELTRLVVLPHLRKLYVAEGNLFSEDSAASSSGNGWRIDLFNHFLREGPAGMGSNGFGNGQSEGRTKDNLLSIDGSPPSWNEKRYLVEPSHSGFSHVESRVQTAHRRDASGPGRLTDGQSGLRREDNGHEYDEPSHRVVTPRRVRQASSASTATTRSTRTKKASGTAAAAAPPPPVPAIPDGLASPGPARQRNASEQSEGVARQANPKLVKRKHRRVVDLDGRDSDSAPLSGDSATGVSGSRQKQHERFASSPHHSTNGSPDEKQDSPSRPTGNGDSQKYHTVSSLPSSTKARTSTRGLASDTFLPPVGTSAATPAPAETTSGSEAEDFRNKMERLRAEVGVENWLSVYASSSNQAGIPRTGSPSGAKTGSGRS